MKVEQVVQNGIELLDTFYTVAWRDYIDLETLNLGSVSDCILGQLGASLSHASFDGMLDLLNLSYGKASDHGFCVYDQLYDYVDLTRAWIDALSH